MENKFIRWQKKTYSARQRFWFLALQAIFFLLILPAGLFYISSRIDAWLKLPPLSSRPANFYIGLFSFFIGLFWSLWAIRAEFKAGQGTPAPIAPTKRLVAKPPYTYCRNPMALGFGLWLFGLALIANSWGFFSLTALIFGCLLGYIKLVEEKELAARFGEEYLRYKKKTPFLLPDFRKRKVF